MSSRNKRKRRKSGRAVDVKEIRTFGPEPRRSSLAAKLEDWILFGDERGRQAMFDLFPLPGGVKPTKRV